MRKKLLSAGSREPNEDGTLPAWCPGPEQLDALNAALAQDPDMRGKRFDVPPVSNTVAPASQYLTKLLPDLDGQSLDTIPASYVVVFNAVLQTFYADPGQTVMSRKVCRMWLVLLLEALATEVFRMRIFPKTTPTRVYSRVGDFVRVSVLSRFHPISLTGGVGADSLLG